MLLYSLKLEIRSKEILFCLKADTTDTSFDFFLGWGAGGGGGGEVGRLGFIAYSVL